ncbi:MAG: Uma2 family endonuclease [Planctomycetes bacterium]|nr:Uma2 family endonuclease [Planctomycetota bacterium]
MIAPILRAEVTPLPRLFTAADLAVLPSELPSGPVLYELDNGRLITMPPPGDIHGAVESNLVTELKNQGERRGLGKVRSGDVGIVLWRNPDRVVGADAVFIANKSLPLRRSPEGYLETIPDLVVEVRSKNDTKPYIERKVADYLTAGVRVVWVPDPDARTLTAYRPGQEPQVFTDQDTLTIEDVIPGLQIAFRDIFQE